MFVSWCRHLDVMTSYCLSASGHWWGRMISQYFFCPNVLFYWSKVLLADLPSSFGVSLPWTSTHPVPLLKLLARVKPYHVDSFHCPTGVQYQRVSIDHLYFVPKQSIKSIKSNPLFKHVTPRSTKLLVKTRTCIQIRKFSKNYKKRLC